MTYNLNMHPTGTIIQWNEFSVLKTVQGYQSRSVYSHDVVLCWVSMRKWFNVKQHRIGFYCIEITQNHTTFQNWSNTNLSQIPIHVFPFQKVNDYPGSAQSPKPITQVFSGRSCEHLSFLVKPSYLSQPYIFSRLREQSVCGAPEYLQMTTADDTQSNNASN